MTGLPRDEDHLNARSDTSSMTVGARSQRTARAMVHLEQQVLTWPQPVGLARMLGLVGVVLATGQLVTWPFLDGLSSPGLHGVLIALIALGSVALLILPMAMLGQAASQAALVAALILQTCTAAVTGTLASPYLSGYVALVLAAALFATWRIALMTVALTAFGLLVLAFADLELSGPDAATLATQGSVCVLVGLTSSLLATRQRHELRRVERRLRLSRRATSQRMTEAMTDPLTGLGNRRAFDRDLAAALGDQRTSGLLLALADVDGLKTINDTYGHPVGDEALRAIGAALRSRVRAGDQVYRIGGDEFAALVQAEDTVALEARFGRSVAADVSVAGRRSASVGVARAKPGDEPATITARADAALYAVKQDLTLEPGAPR
jgi:diguanylate cyclase (GGDEF)-like protein